MALALWFRLPTVDLATWSRPVPPPLIRLLTLAHLISHIRQLHVRVCVFVRCQRQCQPFLALGAGLLGFGFHWGLCRWQGNYIQFAPVRRSL